MAYITTEEVRAIRNQLKAKFPEMRFSVVKRDGMAVNVTIKSGNRDFSDLKSYQINEHHFEFYGEHAKFFEEVVDVIKSAPATVEGGTAWYNNSDSQSDYFDVAFYFYLRVGTWDEDYRMVA